jgi:transcriptional regulator with XRE-family HTH domain
MPPQYTPRFSRRSTRFENQIRTYRIKAGLSQRELGRQLGLGRHAVSAWERGLTCPSTPVLLRLAKTLATLAEALYPGFYNPQQEPLAPPIA